MHQPGEERHNHELKEAAARIFGISVALCADVGAAAKEVTHLHQYKRPEKHNQARQDNGALRHAQKRAHERLVRFHRLRLLRLGERMP